MLSYLEGEVYNYPLVGAVATMEALSSAGHLLRQYNETLYGIAWYKQWTLGRMIQFNTSSPMKNMRTKVRRFKRTYC